MAQADKLEGPLTIIHFNDCYSISERDAEVCGGCPRFITLLKKYPQPKLTLFSGDLWSPSKHTAMFQGEQLVNKFDIFKGLVPINMCEIDCACIGNHDFDLGLETLQNLNSKTNFPWLLSNLMSINGSYFASSLPYHVVEKNGYKVGLIGLIEYDWITAVACLDVDDIIYEDFVTCGMRLAKQLKEDFSYPISTHMRVPNDRRLTALVPDIDLVLGGHDHLYAIEKIEQSLMIKSGTDFLSISEITLEEFTGQHVEEPAQPLNDDNVKSDHPYEFVLNAKWKVNVVKRDVTRSLVPDPAMIEHTKFYENKLAAKMKEPIFLCNVPLDTKFALVRSQECEIGNFIADLMRKEVSADCSIYNSGAIRADFSYTQQLYTVGDLQTIKPFDEQVMVIEITHEGVKQALENGVSKLPALEGRFLQVSHITFEFDPSLPSGSRVNPATLRIDGEHYQPDKKVKMAVLSFAQTGRDGFECLKAAKPLSDPNNIRSMSEIVLEFFMMMKKPELIDEYRVYQIYQKELTQNFIRLKIQSKVAASIQMANQAQQWIEEDLELMKKSKSHYEVPQEQIPLRRIGSHEAIIEGLDLDFVKTLSRGIGQVLESQTNTVKMLTRFNIDNVLSKKALLSYECLIRLRKYQLILTLEKGPHKSILPVIRQPIHRM